MPPQNRPPAISSEDNISNGKPEDFAVVMRKIAALQRQAESIIRQNNHSAPNTMTYARNLTNSKLE